MSQAYGERHDGDGQSYRAIRHIQAQPKADMPAILSMDAVDDSGNITTHHEWWDSNGDKRFKTGSLPTDQDSHGTIISASTGAATTLNNLADTVAINKSLLPGSTNSINLGSASKTFASAHLQTSMVLKQTTAAYTLTWDNPGGARAISIPDPGGTDVFVFEANSVALSNKTYNGLSITCGTNAIALVNGSGNITVGAAGTMDVGAAGSLAVGTGAVAFNGTAAFDLATAKSVNIDNDVVIQGDFTVSTTCTLDQNLSAASAPGWATGVTIGNLTLANGSITDSGGTISFGNEHLITTGNISIGIDGTGSVGRLKLGTAGTSYIEDDGSTLNFYDTTGGPYTLDQLANGTTFDPSVTGNLAIPDGNITWSNSATGETSVWTFAAIAVDAIQIESSVTDQATIQLTADATTSGYLIHLIADDATMTAGAYLYAYDGANQAFAFRRYGALTIAGNASETAALTLTKGDLVLADGFLDLDTGPVDGGHNIATSDDNTSATPLITITNSIGAYDQPLILFDYNATGAYNAVEMTHLGTGYGYKITGGAAGSQGIQFTFAAGGTGNGIFLDGNTNTYVGSATTGMLHIHQSGTLADAAATMCLLNFDGTYDTNGVGACLLVDDDGTVDGTNYAVSINSLAANAVQITTQATGGGNLQLVGVEAQTVAMLDVVGTTGTGWNGAAGVGMVNIASDGAHADATAANLNITTATGACIASARGSALRIIDTQTVGADGWIAYLNTTANDGLLINTGHADGINLKLTGLEAQIASMAIIDGTTGTGWDGADVTGMLHLVVNDMVHTGATALYVDIAAQPIAVGLGVAARFVQSTGSARPGSFLVEIGAVTTGGALHIDSGYVVCDESLTVAGGYLTRKVTVTTDDTDGAVSHSAAEMLGGLILRGTGDQLTSNQTDTTDTAANIVAAIPGAVIGSSFEFCIQVVDGTHGIILDGNTGITLSPADPALLIPAKSTGRFLAVCTNVTGAGEAVTVYFLGYSTSSA